MVRDGQQEVTKNPISLLLAEGGTDEIFYKRIKSDLLDDCRCTVENLQGLYNINVKVIDRVVDYLRQHKDEKIRVYCCLDRESRYGTPPGFDLKRIKRYIKDENTKSVLGVNVIKATQQIESWFFYDIEGIYRFLKVPRTQRNPTAFKPPERFGYKNLQRLFERYNKTYTKGKSAKNFINHLNIEKIVSNCKELNEGIALIQSQATDLTNHLFPAKTYKGAGA